MTEFAVISVDELRARKPNTFGNAYPFVSYATLMALIDAIEAAHASVTPTDGWKATDAQERLEEALSKFSFESSAAVGDGQP